MGQTAIAILRHTRSLAKRGGGKEKDPHRPHERATKGDAPPAKSAGSEMVRSGGLLQVRYRRGQLGCSLCIQRREEERCFCMLYVARVLLLARVRARVFLLRSVGARSLTGPRP